jgi:hypothetical protein
MRKSGIGFLGLFVLAGCGAAPDSESTATTGQEVAVEPMLRRIPVHAQAPSSEEPAVAEAEDLSVEPDLSETTVGVNVNASKEKGPQSETDIAIDPTNAKHLIGGSNDIQTFFMRAYESFDGGKTWTNTALPLAPAPFNGFTSDPSIGFDLAGNAFYSYIGVSSDQSQTSLVTVTKAHGAKTWGGMATVPNVGADKPLLTVDRTTTKFKNSIYVGWDNNTATGQNLMLAHSTNGGKSYTSVKVNHTGTNVIGADPAVGPNGEVYVAWSNYASNVQTLFINKSVDGGKTWGKTDNAIHKWTAATQGGLSITIPADPQRGVSVFASIDVDRTAGAHKGTIYCAYNDATSKNGLDVFVQHSTNGGVTWSAPLRVNDDKVGVVHDQFMPRLAVDQSNGSVSVVFYDTRDDAKNTKTNLYLTRSIDGGKTFAKNIKVTSAQSDEALSNSDANGYGDYTGVAAGGGLVLPFWTDGRTAGNEEVFFSAVTP